MIAITPACQGCGACLLTCPERAIRPADDTVPGAGPLAVLTSRCTGCGECVEICPVDAVGFIGDSMIAVDPIRVGAVGGWPVGGVSAPNGPTTRTGLLNGEDSGTTRETSEA